MSHTIFIEHLICAGNCSKNQEISREYNRQKTRPCGVLLFHSCETRWCYNLLHLFHSWNSIYSSCLWAPTICQAVSKTDYQCRLLSNNHPTNTNCGERSEWKVQGVKIFCRVQAEITASNTLGSIDNSWWFQYPHRWFLQCLCNLSVSHSHQLSHPLPGSQPWPY